MELQSQQFQVASGVPLPEVQAASNRFRAANGFHGSGTQDFSRVQALPSDVTQHLANRYVHAPVMNDDALPSYHRLREEVGRQFDFMTSPEHKGGLGLSVEVTPHDPYVTKSGAPNSLAMMRDVHENKRIKALSTATTGGHPFFTNDENDMFRAVHDVFGHAGTGRNFAQDGEEAAYRSHRQMFTPLARPAMTTETRVQNSLNNLNDNSFLQQKVVVLPGAQALSRKAYFNTLSRQFGGQS